MNPSENAVPTVAKTEGIEEVDLKPEEAFVLSMVNGAYSLKEIAQITSFTVVRVVELLSRVEKAGFIRYEEKGGERAPAKKGKPRTILDRLDVEEGDLELRQIPRSFRNEILLRMEKLGEQNHYEILGLTPRDSNERIKKAYFKLVKEFHPDRYFSLPLGSYKESLGRIFQSITAAYEALSTPERRRQYDAVLRGEASSKGLHK